MTLTTPPLTRLLPPPGTPFVVYGTWVEETPGGLVVKISAANIPGGPLSEFSLGGKLADVMCQIEPHELPIALTTRLAQVDGHAEWVFDYLGSDLAEVFSVPAELQPSPPRPQEPDELSTEAEAMLRESLGLREDEPIPEPKGPLEPHERGAEPPRFDPTKHMDLSTAEPAPPLPPPADPGPPPDPSAQTAPVPQIPPPPSRALGSHIDLSDPFAH